VVEKILQELNLSDKPRVTVFNKLDLAVGSEEELERLTTIPFLEGQSGLSSKNTVLISAAKSWGINKLLEVIGCYLSDSLVHNMMAQNK